MGKQFLQALNFLETSNKRNIKKYILWLYNYLSYEALQIKIKIMHAYLPKTAKT